jgi:ATP-dependent RNA helicase DDX41
MRRGLLKSVLNKKVARAVQNAQAAHGVEPAEPESQIQSVAVTEAPQSSLLDEHSKLRQRVEVDNKNVGERQLEEEAALFHSVTKNTALLAAGELAKGVQYTESIKTSWRPPRWTLNMPAEWRTHFRRKHGIDAEGDDIPPPMPRFVVRAHTTSTVNAHVQDMKLTSALVKGLADRKIATPTAIQMQGIPVALSGRDMIGIAWTGSGKTMVFVLPLIMFCLEQEMAMPFVQGEGPYALIIVPSVCPSYYSSLSTNYSLQRELAKQTFDQIEYFFDCLFKAGKPLMRACLCIGGIELKLQSSQVRRVN